MSIAFDNSLNANEDRGLAVWRDVDIDVDAVFRSLVVERRGGVCYELNGLFRTLLQELGFDVNILAASVRQVNGGFGPELEHIFTCVPLDGDLWLVDVGLAGPSYLEPLRLAEGIQQQYGCQYQIVPDGAHHIAQRRSRNGDWQSTYRFKPHYRDIKEWHDPDPKLVEFPPELLAVGTYIYSRAFDNGQTVLIGRRHVTVTDGYEEVRMLVDSTQYRTAVDQILGRND